MNKSAKKMFKELGFEIWINDGHNLIYRRLKDYEDIWIIFNLKGYNGPSYKIRYLCWQDRENSEDFVPMEKRNVCEKHNFKYGIWKNFDCNVGIELHRAITKQLEEVLEKSSDE
jgi:hypothetical protein